MFRIKDGYVGKVKLESGRGAIVLDNTTPQNTLAQLYETVLGKGFIELVAAPVVAQKNQENVAEH